MQVAGSAIVDGPATSDGHQVSDAAGCLDASAEFLVFDLLRLDGAYGGFDLCGRKGERGYFSDA